MDIIIFFYLYNMESILWIIMIIKKNSHIPIFVITCPDINESNSTYLICFTCTSEGRDRKPWHWILTPHLHWSLLGLSTDTRCWLSKYCTDCCQSHSECSLIPQRDAATPTTLYHTHKLRTSRSRLWDLWSLHEGASTVNYIKKKIRLWILINFFATILSLRPIISIRRKKKHDPINIFNIRLSWQCRKELQITSLHLPSLFF